MVTEGENDEVIKERLKDISERIPIIVQKVEEKKDRKLRDIINNARQLEKYVGKIGEKYSKAEGYLDDMNEACNNMFNFMQNNKIEKDLKGEVIHVIMCVYKINEVYDEEPIYIQYYDNGRYEGEMKDGKREGKGKFYFITGDVYEGEFKNNQKNGKGKYVYCNKDVYEGEYKNGKIHGKGKYTYIEGEEYEGEYKNEKRDGHGVYKYNNGNKYDGEWKDGKKHGKGIFYYSDKSKYDGEFENGKKNGKGKYIYHNGDVYEGQYKKDKREGKGIFTFKGGDKYEGDFKNNFFEGKGIYTYKNGNRYEGEFKKDNFEGKGTFYFKDGDKYEGTWKNDLKDGKGKYTYKNGNVYEGEYKKDHAEGKGIFYHNNGDRNEGEFKAGKPFGEHIKYGIYSTYGGKKELLQDTLIFHSLNNEDKYISLSEYKEKMAKEQKYIYYASGENLSAIKLLPQMEKYRQNGIDVLLLDQKIDEFCIMMLREYDKVEFKSISDEAANELSKEEQSKIESITADNRRLLDTLKEALNNQVDDVTISSKLVDAPVCFSTKDGMSLEMEKTLNEQPGMDEQVKAQKVLEINPDHTLFKAFSSIQNNDDMVKEYASLLYDEAMILEGREITNKQEFIRKINDLITKAFN